MTNRLTKLKTSRSVNWPIDCIISNSTGKTDPINSRPRFWVLFIRLSKLVTVVMICRLAINSTPKATKPKIRPIDGIAWGLVSAKNNRLISSAAVANSKRRRTVGWLAWLRVAGFMLDTFRGGSKWVSTIYAMYYIAPPHIWLSNEHFQLKVRNYKNRFTWKRFGIA